MKKNSLSENNKIAAIYAKALYEVANTKGVLPIIVSSLEGLERFFAEKKGLMRALNSPSCSKKQCLDIVKQLASALLSDRSETSNVFLNFLKLLVKNRRLNLLSEINSAFGEIIAKAEGKQKVKLISAVELSLEQQKLLEEKLEDIMHSRIELESKVDNSIIGGLILRIGSKQIDKSILTRLNKLNAVLKGVS